MTPARSRTAPRSFFQASLALVVLLLGGCMSPQRPAPRPQLSLEAEDAFAQALELWRTGGEADVEAAADLARLALQLSDDWLPPRRLLDDIDRAALRGPEILARYATALEEDPNDPATLYLAGRLDGTRHSEASFRRALAVDPNFAWAHHGLAWSRVRIGDFEAAIDAEHRALANATGSFERAYFAESLARHYALSGRELVGRAMLEAQLNSDDLTAVDRRVLGVRAAVLALSGPLGRLSRDGARRALELLREGGLTETETTELVLGLALATRTAGTGISTAEVRLALRAVEGPARDRLGAQLMLRDGPSPLAIGLLARASADDPSIMALDPEVRAARLAIGDFAGPLEEWLSYQPKLVLADDGLPSDPALREVVHRARAVETANDQGERTEHLVALGEALLDAGWFTEAAGLAQALAGIDVELALSLDDRATAGRALVSSLGELVRKVDTRQPLPVALPADAPKDADDQIKEPDLDGLLAAIEPRFQGFRDAVARVRGEASEDVLLAGSPRLKYGPVGSVVHPGPRFSKADEKLGLGSAGAYVGGLAKEFDDIGRFAVFGEAVGGGGPDGTVLRRLFVEERAGDHFGTKWSGTIAWCDGADLRSRPGRRGARIGGAALHEGYWIDVDTLRAEWRHFRALGERYLDDDEELERVLGVAALPRRSGDDLLPPLLGQADRVRLAILRDRRDAGLVPEGEDLVTLDELVLTTATHEEGHLCDRTRFLPIGSRLWSIAWFFVTSGLSAAGVEERLEYRAQLTALCDTPEARLPLAEILAAAEIGSVGVTPHAAAYTALLEDFLEELDRQLEDDASRYPQLDPSGHLAHQLHRLSTEEVRAIGNALAKREGLAR